MSLEFTGKVTHIIYPDPNAKWQVGSARLEEETTGMYPNSISVNFWNDKIELLDSIAVGDVVYVQLNAKCKPPVNDRMFNGLSVWSLLNETAQARKHASYAKKIGSEAPPVQPHARIGMDSDTASFDDWDEEEVPF